MFIINFWVGLAKWWEHPPSTNIAQGDFLTHAYIDMWADFVASLLSS